MDFIRAMPSSSRETSIWDIFDRFTNLAHFIPLKKDLTKGADLISPFLWFIWRLNGIPKDVVSDRDGRFTPVFWTELLRLLGVKQ